MKYSIAKLAGVLAHRVNERIAAKKNTVTTESVIRELFELGAIRVDYEPQRIAKQNCVVCGCDVKRYDTGAEDLNACATNTVWKDAGLIEISFGFGSRYDVGWAFGLICDSCAKAFVETTAVPMTEAGALGKHFESTEYLGSTD